MYLKNNNNNMHLAYIIRNNKQINYVLSGSTILSISFTKYVSDICILKVNNASLPFNVR